EVLRPARDGLPWWRGHRTEHATQHARGTERAGDARHAGHAQLTRRADLHQSGRTFAGPDRFLPTPSSRSRQRVLLPLRSLSWATTQWLDQPGRHMTQPPGPQGPYPHYPQGQLPSGGFPQQPYPQQGGWPQQQGWPGQPGGWQQQPGGWPDQQQHPYGQPGQFPGDDPFADEDDKKKSKLPWILGGLGALVVIGGVIVLILVLGSGASKGGTAQETAEAFATAFNDRDADGLKALLCEANLQGETGKALDSGEAFANA